MRAPLCPLCCKDDVDEWEENFLLFPEHNLSAGKDKLFQYNMQVISSIFQ